MKRIYYQGRGLEEAASVLFGQKDNFSAEDYRRFDQLELVVQDDGRFSVWGDRGDKAELLRDTAADPHGIVEHLTPYCCEIRQDDA